MKAKIFSGGRVTVPIAIRRRLGLKPGTQLLFDDSVGYIKATK
ncbi:MAG: AbrB/MazE/SpoVT family DNA-binding domain-containing protein [Rhodanobacteraceae bacterium]